MGVSLTITTLLHKKTFIYIYESIVKQYLYKYCLLLFYKGVIFLVVFVVFVVIRTITGFALLQFDYKTTAKRIKRHYI